MNQLILIAKHFDRECINIPIYPIESICAFGGNTISEGVLISDLVSDVFTDWSYLRYDSEYASIEAALCILPVIKTEKGVNSLRNYSYLVTNSEITLLKNSDILQVLINPKSVPFILTISFNCKKYTTYKSVINHSNDIFTVTTDLFNVEIDIREVAKFLPIISNWYSGKNNFFTKQEILTGVCQINKIIAYGIDRWAEENKILETFRYTNLFNLITHILQKK